MTDIPHISVAELASRRATIQLIDVRNPDEFDAARVPGAVLLPLPELPDRLAELPSGTIHFICRSGKRSLTACEFVAQHGHGAVNVTGGILAWIEAGEATDTGSEAP